MRVRTIPWSRSLAAVAAGSLASCALLVGPPDGHREFSSGSDPDSSASASSGEDVIDGGPGPDGGDESTSASSEAGLEAGLDADAVSPREAGFSGPIITLATGQAMPAATVAAPDALYWSNGSDGTVRRLSRSTGGIPAGTPQTVFNVGDAGAGAPSDLLLDGTTLYTLVGPGALPGSSCRTYVDLGLPSAANWYCPKPNVVCAPTSIAQRITFDSTNVYMSNGTCDYLMVAPKPGNDPTSWQRYLQIKGDPIALAADGTDIYLAFDHEIDVQLIAALASAPGSFALSYTPVVDLVADDVTVFWMNNGGDVESLAKARANAPPTVLATLPLHPVHLTVDGSNVYWTNQGAVGGQGSVVMISKDGGAPITLAASQANPSPIAVDGVGVYWGNAGDGTIRMIAR